MPANLISTLLSSIVMTVIIALFFTGLLWFLMHQLKKHPASGTVVGKAQHEGQFLLYLWDSKGRYTWISTNESRWLTTSINDHYQMDIPGGDWYVLSM